MSQTRDQLMQWGKPIGLIALFLAAVFLAFGHSLTQGFAPIDDVALIARNLAIRGPTWENLRTVFTTFDPELYIPLTFVSFQIDYVIAGLNPWIYHLTNLLLHTGNALLVYLLAKHFTRRPFLTLFAGLLFAVHPLMTESVVWIMIRKDLLATFFSLLTLLLYLKGTRKMLLLSSVTFLLALLAKVTAAPLPIALLLGDLLLSNLQLRAALRRVSPFVLLSAVFLFVAVYGKHDVLNTADPLTMIVLAGKNLGLTLQHFFLPLHLIPFYEEPVSSLFSGANIAALVFALLFVLASVGMSFRMPRLGFGLLFFTAMLAITFLSPFRAGATYGTADHYAYLPAAGLVFALTALLARIEIPAEYRTIPRTAGGILLLLLCLMSLRQTKRWDSAESLFTYALQVLPSSVAVRTAHANILLKEGKPEEAFAILKEGLALGDDPRLHLAAGMVYAKTGQTADAERQFRKAADMDPGNPEPIFSLGSLLEQTGRKQEAKEKFTEALALDPVYVAAFLGLGRIALNDDDFARAETEFRSVLSLNGNLPEAHRGLAQTLEQQGKNAEAQEHRRIADFIENPER